MTFNRQNPESFEQEVGLFTSTFKIFVLFSLFLGLVVRIILLFNEQTPLGFSFVDWLKIFLLGAVNDICISIIGGFFIWLLLFCFSKNKYKNPLGYIILSLIAILLCYVSFFNTVLNEYGSNVSKIAQYVLLYKLLSFGTRLFVPSIRKKWRIIVYCVVFSLYIYCLLFNAIGEYLFWDEFGVRYNFIAVDYLVYTNEVIGNIFESYPVIPLLTALFIVSSSITYVLLKMERKQLKELPNLKDKLIISAVYFVLFAVSLFVINFNSKFQNSENVYVNELQANAAFKFYTAFKNSSLDYDEFYVTLNKQKAIDTLNKEYKTQGENNSELIKDSLAEIHKNVVLITVESMSANFLAHYGNKENITPYLDKLMDKSLVFDNLFATGNRTVRGLEALTLSLPPSPGESIIKRPNNQNLFSTGKAFKDKGYKVQYLYGGDSYFDNMKTFFSGNGYEVIDKKSFSKDEITFSNIWGVCDEDMFNKAIEVFNKDTATGQPFFGHIMTVSNHRPFTYPQGRINISVDSKSREGGVKYTDYAIGKFMEKAEKQAWFNNTVFVIVADHSASSAGKTEIPLEKYHIPALIYAPGYIQPKQIKTLVSQIDIMPTVLGLLHFSYASNFYGKDIFSPNYRSRALVATYQNLGYWEGNLLNILSPLRKVEQYRVESKENNTFNLIALNKTDSASLKIAIANYQTLAYQFGKKSK